MVHCHDLVGLVTRTAQTRRPRRDTTREGLSEEFPESPPEGGADVPFFSAATDGSTLTLGQVLKKIGAGQVAFRSTEAALEAALRDPDTIKWNMDLSFPADPSKLQFPEGLSTRFKEIWAEFLAEQNLLPVSYVVTGPPGSGKTVVAQALASRYSSCRLLRLHR